MLNSRGICLHELNKGDVLFSQNDAKRTYLFPIRCKIDCFQMSSLCSDSGLLAVLFRF